MKKWLIVIGIFVLIDLFWLGILANPIYDKYIGDFLRPDPLWLPALLFYGLFITGLVYFALDPALKAKNQSLALKNGALFGFYTYMTYELTNYAVLDNWPWQIVPIDIAWEALVGHTTFVARSFAGDPKQVKELIKAAIHHNGIAVLDIISPCVTFNNTDTAIHSYAWGKEHEVALHDLSYVPPADEIQVSYEPGQAAEVTMHDGSKVVLQKLERDYDPTDRAGILCMLEEANRRHELVTGLIYIDTEKPSLLDRYNLPDFPLNRLSNDRLRPKPETVSELNALMF